MGDRLGIQGAVGFIFTLLTVTGALILPGQEPTSCPGSPFMLFNTLAELKTAARQPPSVYVQPHHIEHTPSRPIWEVKQRRALSVPGWVTAWEYRVQ